MGHFLVSLSYQIEASKTYHLLKNFTYDTLENNLSRKKRLFDPFMIFLVLSTVAILIYEVNHELLPWLDSYETFAIIVFIVEWLGRLWISSDSHSIIIEDYEKTQILDQKYEILRSIKKILKKKFEFIISPMSIVDLLAILPYYRPLRILRIFLLFRLFKILRYTNSINQFSRVFIEKRFEFFTLAIMFTMMVTFGSTIMFVYEGGGVNPKVDNFFDAVYWSVITISTVGYGDVTPTTTEGKLVTVLLVISAFSVIAFFTSIVTTALTERMKIIKEEKVIAEASRLRDFVVICGYGRMGSVLAGELNKIKQRFIIIDNKEETLDDAKTKNYLAIKGDATNTHLLEDIGVKNGATSIVAMTDSDAVNLSITLGAKSLNPDINIIARVNNIEAKHKLKIAGANEVVLSNEITALVSSEYVGQPVAFEAIDDILLDTEGAVMDEIEILENSEFIGHKLNEIDLDGFNLSLIGIIEATHRKDFRFNPNKEEYEIKAKDILIVIGNKEAIAEFGVYLLSSKPKFYKL